MINDTLHAIAGATESEPATVSTQSQTFVNEAAILGMIPVCRRTLKSMRDRGEIPFIRIGGRILFHPPSVQTALLRMQRGGAR